jgi:hypothetical protein
VSARAPRLTLLAVGAAGRDVAERRLAGHPKLAGPSVAGGSAHMHEPLPHAPLVCLLPLGSSTSPVTRRGPSSPTSCSAGPPSKPPIAEQAYRAGAQLSVTG